MQGRKEKSASTGSHGSATLLFRTWSGITELWAPSGLGACVFPWSLAGDVPTSGVQSYVRQRPGELRRRGSELLEQSMVTTRAVRPAGVAQKMGGSLPGGERAFPAEVWQRARLWGDPRSPACFAQGEAMWPVAPALGQGAQKPCGGPGILRRTVTWSGSPRLPPGPEGSGPPVSFLGSRLLALPGCALLSRAGALLPTVRLLQVRGCLPPFPAPE